MSTRATAIQLAATPPVVDILPDNFRTYAGDGLSDPWQVQHFSIDNPLAGPSIDAQLAALAVEHQAELHSADSNFHRFAGLRWRNPLT